MKVTIQYTDTESLTVESIVKQAQQNYGPLVTVKIEPESTMAYDYIYHGLQQLMTQEQISLLFEKNVNYPEELKALRNRVLAKVADINDQVIIDNEGKVTT